MLNFLYIYFNNQRLISCQFNYSLDNDAEIEEGTGGNSTEVAR